MTSPASLPLASRFPLSVRFTENLTGWLLRWFWQCYLKTSTGPRREHRAATSGSHGCCSAVKPPDTRDLPTCSTGDAFDCLQLDFFVVGFAKAGTSEFDNVLNSLSDDIGTYPVEWPFLHYKVTPEKYARQWVRCVDELDRALSDLSASGTRVNGLRNPAQAWHQNEMAALARSGSGLHQRTKLIVC